MLIFRYIAKEVLITMAALTTILLLIFLSNDFMLYLKRAADGQIPVMILLKLMAVELPSFLPPLLPLGFYISLLLVLGRLYAESEMVVMQASGYSRTHLLKQCLWMSIILSLCLVFFIAYLGPLIQKERNRLLDSSGVQILIQTIAPGRFQSISNGKQVFYVEHMNRAHSEGTHVFLASQNKQQANPSWNILWADKASLQINPHTDEHYLTLHQGGEYEGVPGHAAYQVAHFDKYRARLPHPVILKKGANSLTLKELLPIVNANKEKAAELQWRIANAFMVIPLTLIAVPLSRVNPRAGKFAKMLPAIFIYFLYANFVFVGRDWIKEGVTPTWLGLWWLHGLAIALGLFLLFRDRKRLS